MIDLPRHLESCRQEALKLRHLIERDAVQAVASRWLSRLETALESNPTTFFANDRLESAVLWLLEIPYEAIRHLSGLLGEFDSSDPESLPLIAAAVDQLNGCVTLHSRAWMLISTASLQSQYFCDQPVSRNELNKRREASECQRIFLGIRLKETFHCRTLAALRWNHLAIDSFSPSNHNLGLPNLEESPFLSLLGSKAADFSCKLVQQTLLLPLVKAAVYLFDIIDDEIKPATGSQRAKADSNQRLIHLCTCAWIVYNILEHPDWRKDGMREVIEVLVEGVLCHLRSQGNLQDALASITDMNEYEVLIFDPTIDLLNSDEYPNQRPRDETPATQQAILQSYESPGVQRHKTRSDHSQTDCESIEPRPSSGDAPDSVSPYLGEVFSLDTTAGNSTLIMDEQKWVPSKVYLPIRFSPQQDFDIQVERADSPVSNIKIKPSQSRLVLGYAYNSQSPHLWIYDHNNEPTIIFRNDCPTLIEFTGALMQKQISYYGPGSIKSLVIDKNSKAGRKCYVNAVAVILTPEYDDNTEGVYDSSLSFLTLTDQLNIHHFARSASTIELSFQASESSGAYIEEGTQDLLPALPLSTMPDMASNTGAGKVPNENWNISISFVDNKFTSTFYQKLRDFRDCWKKENHRQITSKEPKTSLYETKSILKRKA